MTRDKAEEAPGQPYEPLDALTFLARGNDWLKDKLEQGASCACNCCYLCAYEQLRAALSSPCEEPIDTDYEAVLWHDYDDLYHLDTNLSKHLPSLLPRQKVKVHVIILAEPQGE